MDQVQQFFRTELGYVALLFALFVIPRVLQRWRLPSALTSFGLGVIAGMAFGLFDEDGTLHLLSTFGIVGLFLFAGLEVDFHDLRTGARVVSQHLAVRLVLLILAALAAERLFFIPLRPAALVALALLTPSTGFILDSLSRFGLKPDEVFWVKSKAIATEILALLVLFVALQSTSPGRLALAALALLCIVAILPPSFRIFAARVVPWAPNSEFAFLIMMAVVAAYATRQLGVYYLVGAFLVGIAARRFREALPAMASERMLHAVEVFASFFAPFYFFAAGAALRRADFSLEALAIGIALAAVVLPIRLAAVVLHRRAVLREKLEHGVRVALPMLPTLVFTLVIVGILRDAFQVPPALLGGLIVYTVINTIIPGLVLIGPTPGYDAPELPPGPEGMELPDDMGSLPPP